MIPTFLQSHFLTKIRFWLTSPSKEDCNILSHLRGGGGGALRTMEAKVGESEKVARRVWRWVEVDEEDSDQHLC